MKSSDSMFLTSSQVLLLLLWYVEDHTSGTPFPSTPPNNSIGLTSTEKSEQRAAVEIKKPLENNKRK